MDEKDEVLRFKVTVNPVSSELYEVLYKAGKYYRSRKLLELALLGLAVEKGRLMISPPLVTAPAKLSVAVPAAPPTQPSSINQSDEPQHKYQIPDCAAQLIGDMLDSM